MRRARVRANDLDFGLIEAGSGPLALCLHGFPGAPTSPSSAAGRYAAEQQAALDQAPQPTLYLHGATDGCVRADLARGAELLLAPSSRMLVIEDAGHFLHLEKPTEVNDHILAWVS